VLTVAADRTAPSVSGPRLSITTGQQIGTDVAVKVSFPATDGGTGIASTAAAERVDGSWRSISLAGPTAMSATRRLAFHHAYLHRATVTDRSGNATTRDGPLVMPRAVSELSGSYGGHWGSVKTSSAWGGALRYSATRSSTVTFRFTGRSVGWVSLKAPSRGQASVYVDGHYAAKVDLRSGSVTGRLVVFSKSWSSAGTHTVKIVVLGTAGRPRVDVDGFVYLP